MRLYRGIVGHPIGLGILDSSMKGALYTLRSKRMLVLSSLIFDNKLVARRLEEIFPKQRTELSESRLWYACI